MPPGDDDMPEPDMPEPDDMPGEVPVALSEVPCDWAPIAPGAGAAPVCVVTLPEVEPGIWPVTPVALPPIAGFV